MTSLMMILVAARLSSVRQGFIRGLILGTLAGMAIWGGLDQRLKLVIAARELAAQPPQANAAEADGAKAEGAEEPAGGDPAPTDAEGLGHASDAEAPVASGPEPPTAGDTEPLAASDAETVKAREVIPYTQEDRQRDQAIRSRLPYYTVPPPMVICPTIGMLFAHLAGKRRAKIRSMWD